jgi:hypothetical protein
LPVGDVVARVDDEPVEPGREAGVASELADSHTELCQRFLSGIPGVLVVGKHLRGQALDARRVPLAKRRERPLVAVLCSPDKNGITEPLVDQRRLAPWVLQNLTALAQRRLHGA